MRKVTFIILFVAHFVFARSVDVSRRHSRCEVEVVAKIDEA